MPQMIPSHPVAGSPTSEKVVFAALEQSLPPDWIVIHSKRFVLPRFGTNRRPVEREVDFIIFNPRRGYLGLEVKGGKEIGRDRNGWYSISSLGKKHEIRDPGEQAQSATKTINKYLMTIRDLSSWQPPDGWGVCFPGVSVEQDLDSGLPIELSLIHISEPTRPY